MSQHSPEESSQEPEVNYLYASQEDAANFGETLKSLRKSNEAVEAIATDVRDICEVVEELGEPDEVSGWGVSLYTSYIEGWGDSEPRTLNLLSDTTTKGSGKRYRLIDIELEGEGGEEPLYLGSLAVPKSSKAKGLPEIRYDLGGKEELIENWPTLTPDRFKAKKKSDTAKLVTREDKHGNKNPEDLQLQALLTALQLTTEHLYEIRDLEPEETAPAPLTIRGVAAKLKSLRGSK